MTELSVTAFVKSGDGCGSRLEIGSTIRISPGRCSCAVGAFHNHSSREVDRFMRRNSVRNKNKINTMNSNRYKLLIQILIYGSNPYNKYMNDSNTPLKLKLNKIVTRKQCLFLQNMELSPNYHKLPLG